MTHATAEEISPHTKDLVDFIRNSASRTLPEPVALKGKLHLLDTLAAIISGLTLPQGQAAVAFARREQGLGAISVPGTDLRLPCVSAAFATGMLAHADETDDSHAASLTHPGCAVVPSALAYGQLNARSGLALLNAVVTGYETAARINTALGPRALSDRGHGPHSIGGHWGACAAAAALCDFDARQIRHALSYVGQQTAGVACWMRDEHHILKAFVFAGMPSRNGAFAVEMVAAGLPGMEDVLSGTRNFLYAYSDDPKPELISQDLGQDFSILTTAVKKWCVGSPIQSALDSLQAILRAQGLGPQDIAKIKAHIPDHAVHVIDNNAMPDVNLQQCFALMLIDGTLTFAAGHDLARMHDPEVMAQRAKVEIVPSRELTLAVPARQAIVEIHTTDGRHFEHRTYATRGTPGNPMEPQEVIDKAVALMTPVIGAARTQKLVKTVMEIEQLADVRDLAGIWA